MDGTLGKWKHTFVSFSGEAPLNLWNREVTACKKYYRDKKIVVGACPLQFVEQTGHSATVGAMCKTLPSTRLLSGHI